ncbi:MAG: PHP domain-containing protein [Clostridiaceae bacterium]
MKLDLHCHTTCSDGRLSSNELALLAKNEGLKLMSLTDHDTVAGHKEIAPLLEKEGIRFIPGIELTTGRNHESIHILGYFKTDSYMNKTFLDALDHLFINRNTRIEKMIDLLKTHFNLDINYEELRSTSKGVLTRANLAGAISKALPDVSHDDIFTKYLSKESPAYIPNLKLSVPDGIKFLKDNGAIAVLAHPVIYKKNDLEDLLQYDFDGLECYYFLNDEKMTERSLKLAKEKNLFITVGSDYHGIPGDTRHGYLGSMTYDENDLQPFLNQFM